MKYIKWIKVTVKLGICILYVYYIVQKKKVEWLTVNKFGSKKGRREEEAIWAKCAPLCPEGSLWMRMLFGVGLNHASDFRVGDDTTNC